MNVIYNLNADKHTHAHIHMHTQTHRHTNFTDKSNFKGQHLPGLKISDQHTCIFRSHNSQITVLVTQIIIIAKASANEM